jgi:hypothetical protein
MRMPTGSMHLSSTKYSDVSAVVGCVLVFDARALFAQTECGPGNVSGGTVAVVVGAPCL